MGRSKMPFSLTKRNKSKGGKIWYYRTYDQFNTRTNWRSTGCTSRAKAEKFCIELLRNDLLVADSSMTLSKYVESKSFFQYGRCEYTAYKKLGKTYAKDCLSRMNNHILPMLGKLSLRDITANKIDEWQMRLLSEGGRNLSRKTVKNIRSVLRIILKEAFYNGLMNQDVFIRVRELPDDDEKKDRGILTEAEINKLFDPQNLTEYWKDNETAYLASYLACMSGMRQGEIRAITPENLLGERILVNASYGKHGLGPTKTKASRKVWIPPYLMDLLRTYSVHKAGFIFSYSGGLRPLSGNGLTRTLYNALDKMGLGPEVRKERNITFHSFRHWYVTQLRGSGVPEAEIVAQTGQKTESVRDGYTKYDMIGRQNVIDAITRLNDKDTDSKPMAA